MNGPPAPLLAPPMPCGYAGSIATGSAVAGLRIRGSSWICGVNGCNVAPRNEKTASRRVLRKPLVVEHLGLQVTGSRRDRATEYPTSLAALGHSDKLITPP